MEIVVLNSDIARLVLDYLKSQKLKKATRTFCKTSPYLKQEFSAYKQGLQTHSFFPELEEIICEYVKISRKVEHLLPKLTDALRSKLQQCKLSEKVNELLERATHAILVSNVSGSKTDLKSSAPTVAASQIGNVANENDGNKAKRKRSFENSNNSNDDLGAESNIHKPNKLTPSRLGHCSKKRRILQPYCFLSAKALQRYKRGYHTKLSTTTTSTDEDVDEENDEESPSSVEGITNSSSEIEVLNGNDDRDEEEIFNSEKPSKESTPQIKSNRKGELMAPIIPGISQAILDNVEFQERLAENINQALNKSLGSKSTTTVPQKDHKEENTNTPSKKLAATAEEITSSQLLDQMIKNILDATEKEPSFDAIIQEVVESSNKQPQVQSAAVQCNIKDTNLPPAVVGNPSLYIATEPPPLVTAQPITQLQQYPAPTSPTTETITTNRNILTIPATNVQQQPRTPIILRSAPVATAATSSVISSTTLTGQEPPPTMLGNNTIGSLIDPNFSISKLIVLNSNDSIQKQIPETTTADNLIGQMSTSGIVDANDEQVYFDTTTGQITFPVFITNDGIVTNFPFFINNEFVSHQLQTNNMSNVEGTRSEIPFGESIVVSANQLPPNTIILSNAQMESISEKPGTSEKNNTKEQYNKNPPASLDNRLLHDKATPSPSGIINTKAFKSLSTPRKRTSHVRTLTFSPRGPQSVNNIGTPLSTRTDAICRYQRSFPKAIIEENRETIDESESKSIEKENTSEKPVIKTVEILPAITSAISETVIDNTNASTTETSSIPPLFVSEESSNQTIINKHAPVSTETSKESSKPKDFKTVAAQEFDKTPKRKQSRKTAVRSCKRQLTKAANEIENELSEEKPEKENEKTTADSANQPDTTSTKDPLMEEWLRLRNSHVDLDVRLREINAKSTQSTQVKKVNTKKRVRRKKPAAVKKKEKELVKKAEELERSKELANETQCQDPDTENQDIVELDKHSSNENPGVENDPTQEVDLKEDTTQNVNDKTAIPNTTKQDKMTEQKENSSEKIVKPDENYTTNAEAPPTASCQDLASVSLRVNDALEREKRTTNIAFLLETPFKDPNLASCNPPTPGIFAPSLETPAGKLKDREDEMQASASFLFGSITKSELDTPLTTALTPGFRFTPFGLKEIATPKSLPGTDYSSGGGSYYKPDESEDLDRNIDKMLRSSAQKKVVSKEANDSDDVEQPEEGEIVVEECRKERVEEIDIEKVEIEIPMEKLKVEPIVLKRVKSFSSEDVECIETAKIDPHYTLASGLPEISAAEEECSSSSSSSSGSSSSSKSSSSSSSDSSSSSSSSSSSDASATSRTVLETSQSTKQANINELDSLSEISSTEDEEWQKLAVTDNDENSQLVGNDGEVRYPVRSWLTPIKEKITIETKTFEHTEVTQSTTSTKSTTIKVSLPLKSAEKRNREVKELELKKERIREKLKIDASTTARKEKPAISATPNISAALAATRMLHAMRDKGKKSASYQMPLSADSNTVAETSPTVQEKRSLDVLTALNLSAKKHLPKTPENPQKQTPRLSEDNETLADSTNNSKEKNKIKISPPTTNKTPQRKCLPIEARPVARTIRKSGKKIVRTPLAFKVIHSPGKINSHSTTTTLAELAATKTLNKSKEAEGGPFIPQTVRVSPRLMKTSKLLVKKSPESPAPKSKVTTRNAKAKNTAAPKPKVTRSRNQNKDSAKAPLEKEMKELLKDWKDESLEKKNVEQQFEDETVQQNSVAAIKPKIHLKARNAMISMKQKNIAKRELLAAHKLEEEKTEETKTLSKELLSVHQVVSTSKTVCASPQTVKADLLPLTTAASDCNNEDEDDPLVDCEMTTIDETDTKRFIKYTFNGPDGPPAAAPKLDELSNFQMLVAIDENEKHIWRITEGICLFSCAPSLPKPAATVPKKRKMRVSTVTAITSEGTASKGSAASTATTNTKIANLKAFSTNMPKATSTPVAIQTSSSRTTAENNKQAVEAEGGSKSKVVTRQTAEASKKSLPETSNETPKIQIEDIESILSHLHGT